MKLIFFASLLISLTIAATVNSNNPSNINLAVDYDTLDTIKYNVVRPLVTRYMKNLTLPGYSYTERFGRQGAMVINVSNVAIHNVNLDWENSHLLTIGERSNSTIVLKNVDALIQFDFAFKTLMLSNSGPNNMMNITLDILLNVDFANNTNNLFYTKIIEHQLSVKSLNINWNPKIAFILKNLEKLFGMSIRQIVERILEDGLMKTNATLVEKTSQPIIFSKSNSVEQRLSLVNLPQTIYDILNGQKRTVKTFNLNLEAFKNNQLYNTSAKESVMPNIYPNFAPIQTIINERTLEIALWTAFQTGYINSVISNRNLRADSKISLNTTYLKTLFPHLEGEYGANKGVYIKITKGGDYPTAKISQERIQLKGAFKVELYVDKDSSEYPQVDLDLCRNCEKAIALNVTALMTATLYETGNQKMGVRIIDVNLREIEVLSGKTDGKNLINKLKYPLLVAVDMFNEAFKGGIDVPGARIYRVNSTRVMFDEDRVALGFDFKVQNKLIVE